MRVVKALEEFEPQGFFIGCFMAGGMGNTQWHDTFLNFLQDMNANHLVVFNPYNPDCNTEQECIKQIEWEHKYLTKFLGTRPFIFSCYFDKYTDQPISFYEVGMMLQKTNGNDCVINCHPQFKKKLDLKTQCKLVGYNGVREITPIEHALAVFHTYRYIKKQFC